MTLPHSFWATANDIQPAEERSPDPVRSRCIARCAVLGNRRWEAWLTQLSKALFRSAEIRYFHAGECEVALEWLRESDLPL